MRRLGRPPSNPPETVYSRRRYIVLVQVLALDNPAHGLYALCIGWGVEPEWDTTITGWRKEPYYLDVAATAQKLARYVMEFHRQEQR